MNRINAPERLALNKFELDETTPHILVDQDKCRQLCKTRPCLFVCPADLYSEQDGAVLVEWAGCLECGTCQAVCPHQALSWQYPRGGCGIFYRYG